MIDYRAEEEEAPTPGQGEGHEELGVTPEQGEGHDEPQGEECPAAAIQAVAHAPGEESDFHRHDMPCRAHLVILWWFLKFH